MVQNWHRCKIVPCGWSHQTSPGSLSRKRHERRMRNVKGVLYADYVRMIRSHKGIDWTRLLHAEDLRYLRSHIDPERWYPMSSFERLGNAILAEIAHSNLDSVRLWGRHQVEQLRALHPMLVAERDPV